MLKVFIRTAEFCSLVYFFPDISRTVGQEEDDNITGKETSRCRQVSVRMYHHCKRLNMQEIYYQDSSKLAQMKMLGLEYKRQDQHLLF
uniref:Uncharacterized protein n=1 Tax=Arion vulgaris TaxID=1028688 RepID=A0A0B7AK11_9EUPU